MYHIRKAEPSQEKRSSANINLLGNSPIRQQVTVLPNLLTVDDRGIGGYLVPLNQTCTAFLWRDMHGATHSVESFPFLSLVNESCFLFVSLFFVAFVGVHQVLHLPLTDTLRLYERVYII